MAGWALALSIVPFPPGWLLSVVLACVTLSRPRHGAAWGRGYAVAALIVVGAWLLVAVGGVPFVLSLSAEREDGHIVQGGRLSVFELAAGDCFDLPGGRPGDVMAAPALALSPGTATIDAVPCTEPHHAEVYVLFDLYDGYPGESERGFPGEAWVVREAQRGCELRFESFVGLPYERSVLEIYFLHPAEWTWNELGDREVVCAVMEPSGKTTEPTLRDARR